MDPAAAAERVARESYGRLLAYLAARASDIAAAEDALADAFAAALLAWPKHGAPDNPEAWLFAAAKRKLIDAARRAGTARIGARQVAINAEQLDAETQEGRAVPDRRLALLFACAHPAIDAAARTPLMLQAVLGFSAERIAAAFLVAPAAMGQRLVRAKAKIKDAGVSFALPEPDAWPERLPPVLEAVYAAYAEGWRDPTGADAGRRELAGEGIWLARLLAAHLPNEPEALGLLALVLHLEARRDARRDAAGAFVPLLEQQVARWDHAMIAEAEAALRHAAAIKRVGRFQLEAAIQSAHAARAQTGVVDWAAIAELYAALEARTRSPVAALNRAAAVLEAHGPEAAAAIIAPLAERLADYQPFWALKAHLAARAGRTAEAAEAYDEAIRRESDPALIAFLRQRAQALRP